MIRGERGDINLSDDVKYNNGNFQSGFANVINFERFYQCVSYPVKSI